jgi:hypothetical protein
MRNGYKITIGNSEGKGPLERSRHRWKDNIEVDLRKCGWGVLTWFMWVRTAGRWGFP